jgi:thiol:disulfide interchange protein
MPRVCLTVLIFAMILLGTSRADANERYETYTSERLAALQAEGKTVLVNVHADWCPTCRQQSAVLDVALLEPRYAALPALKLDWDDQRDAGRALGAPRQSTFLVFRGGKRRAISVAETDEAKLRAFLDRALE